MLRIFDLARTGRHFGPRAPVNQGDLRGSAAECRARRVEGGVAAANHQHTAAHHSRPFQVHAPQKLQAADYARQVFARHRQPALQVGADGDEHRGVLPAQFVEANGPADRRIHADLDAECGQPFQLGMQHRPGQPERGNAHRQHPAGHR